MTQRYLRWRKELALLLVIAMVFTVVGCKTRKSGSKVTSSLLEESSETTAETSETSETTDVSITETSESTTTSETSEAVTDSSETEEPTVPGETPSDPTATPTDEPIEPTATSAPTSKPSEPTATSTPKPTKAPKETKATATPTTPPTNTPTSTSTPTPVPTDTPTATPTTPPKTAKDANDYMGTARSAIKQAIVDNCGWKSGFQINDNMVANEKARAKYSVNNNYYGHGDISGTIIPLEACCGTTSEYFADSDTIYFYWWDNNGTQHTYKNDAYQCYYDCAAYLVKNHTAQLASDETYIYFGYGAAIKSTPWSDGSPHWDISVYIGADSSAMYAVDFP